MTARPPDHYALLGVDHHADQHAIRRAYVARVKEYHPDFGAGRDAFGHFQDLQRAYHCLRSPEQRARYNDAMRAIHQQQLQRLGRARRRLRRLDHTQRIITATERMPHWRAAAALAACGSIVLSTCYLLLR